MVLYYAEMVLCDVMRNRIEQNLNSSEIWVMSSFLSEGVQRALPFEIVECIMCNDRKLS